MTRKTIIFFLDAVREDYISKETTPFLNKLKNDNTYLKLISQIGYSSGIHPSIWSGKHQEKTGKFLVYSFDEHNSDFKWMRFLKIIPPKVRQYLIGFLKTPYYINKFPKKILPKFYIKKILPIPASINPKTAKYFKIEDKKFENKLFEILSKNGISCKSIVDKENINYGEQKDLELWDISNNDLDLFFSWKIDILGHYPGPKSKEL